MARNTNLTQKSEQGQKANSSGTFGENFLLKLITSILDNFDKNYEILEEKDIAKAKSDIVIVKQASYKKADGHIGRMDLTVLFKDKDKKLEISCKNQNSNGSVFEKIYGDFCWAFKQASEKSQKYFFFIGDYYQSPRVAEKVANYFENAKDTSNKYCSYDIVHASKESEAEYLIFSKIADYL